MRYFIVFLLLALSQPLFADNLSRPDAHAPIGVMGDHMHHKGEWMISYRFMHMHMDGNRKGDSDQSTADVLADFAVAPLDMDMDMHMLGAMYAPMEDLTLMLMLPYVELSMDHVTRMGAEFTTTSSGIGDVKFSGLYRLFDNHQHSVHLNLGMAFPTGNIDERDDTPLGNVVLPYPMQIGSGTYDLLSGLTYNGHNNDWSWGGQVMGTFRLENNDENYSLGDRVAVSGWLARRWSENISTSLRLDGQAWGNYDGADPRIARTNPMGVPIVATAQPDLRGGSRLDLGVGGNYIFTNGMLKNHRIALEFLLPIQQNLDGPQLETDWTVTVGWQKAF